MSSFCEQRKNLCRVGVINCDFHSIAINQKHQTEQIEMMVVASNADTSNSIKTDRREKCLMDAKNYKVRRIVLTHD